MKLLKCAALTAALLALCLPVMAAPAADAPVQTVSALDVQKLTSAGNEHFTGTVRMHSVYAPQAPSDSYAAFVVFEPGARTHWHIHEKGQTLIVTEGVGYTQEYGKEPVELHPGDIVRCPPGVMHWHGAAPGSAMTHLAISETGKVTWLEPVTDAKYPQNKQ